MDNKVEIIRQWVVLWGKEADENVVVVCTECLQKMVIPNHYVPEYRCGDRLLKCSSCGCGDGGAKHHTAEEKSRKPGVRRPKATTAVKKSLYGRLKQGPVVYFVKNQQGLVKIGTTRTIGRRVHGFFRNSGAPATLLAVEPGSSIKEKSLHYQFQDYQVDGEWFRLEGKLLLYIAQLWADQTIEHGTVIPLDKLVAETRYRRYGKRAAA